MMALKIFLFSIGLLGILFLAYKFYRNFISLLKDFGTIQEDKTFGILYFRKTESEWDDAGPFMRNIFWWCPLTPRFYMYWVSEIMPMIFSWCLMAILFLPIKFSLYVLILLDLFSEDEKVKEFYSTRVNKLSQWLIFKGNKSILADLARIVLFLAFGLLLLFMWKGFQDGFFSGWLEYIFWPLLIGVALIIIIFFLTLCFSVGMKLADTKEKDVQKKKTKTTKKKVVKKQPVPGPSMTKQVKIIPPDQVGKVKLPLRERFRLWFVKKLGLEGLLTLQAQVDHLSQELIKTRQTNRKLIEAHNSAVEHSTKFNAWMKKNGLRKDEFETLFVEAMDDAGVFKTSNGPKTASTIDAMNKLVKVIKRLLKKSNVLEEEVSQIIHEVSKSFPALKSVNGNKENEKPPAHTEFNFDEFEIPTAGVHPDEHYTPTLTDVDGVIKVDGAVMATKVNLAPDEDFGIYSYRSSKPLPEVDPKGENFTYESLVNLKTSGDPSGWEEIDSSLIEVESLVNLEVEKPGKAVKSLAATQYLEMNSAVNLPTVVESPEKTMHPFKKRQRMKKINLK